MLEELQRRNYSESTIRAYIRTLEHYSRHFHRSPDQLGPEHIRQYQAAMFREWKLAPNTVTQKLAALRFFLNMKRFRAGKVLITLLFCPASTRLSFVNNHETLHDKILRQLVGR